jgi:hypothetical protein
MTGVRFLFPHYFGLAARSLSPVVSRLGNAGGLPIVLTYELS